MFKKALVNNSINSQIRSVVHLTSRYCAQNNFNLLICGGNNVRFDKTSRKVTQIDGKDVNKMTYIAPMNQCRNMFKAVCLKGEIYVLVVGIILIT